MDIKEATAAVIQEIGAPDVFSIEQLYDKAVEMGLTDLRVALTGYRVRKPSHIVDWALWDAGYYIARGVSKKYTVPSAIAARRAMRREAVDIAIQRLTWEAEGLEVYSVIAGDMPVLDAYDDGEYQYYVWCEYCGKWHLHGRLDGHRVSHCYNYASPYVETGYVIRKVGEWKNRPVHWCGKRHNANNVCRASRTTWWRSGHCPICDKHKPNIHRHWDTEHTESEREAWYAEKEG